METVEPIYHALCSLNMQLLFDTLGIKRYPISQKSEKEKWKSIQDQLCEARNKRAIKQLMKSHIKRLIPN